jgi:hypothetical protein
MGYYYDPPQELPKVARLIRGNEYEQLKAQLEDGERLFGHYDRPFQGFQNAVWLFSAEEMEEFESQYRGGKIDFLGFYAMPAETFIEYFGSDMAQR